MSKVTFILPLVIPLMAGWAAWHEKRILKTGEPLPAASLRDAIAAGVRQPQKIRVLQVVRIPLLNGRLIKAVSKFFPMITPHTVGLSLRYGIYLRQGCKADYLRQLIAHECVHTAQYERCGGFMEFMMRYFSECLRYGYHSAPMEREAITTAARICPVVAD